MACSVARIAAALTLIAFAFSMPANADPTTSATPAQPTAKKPAGKAPAGKPSDKKPTVKAAKQTKQPKKPVTAAAKPAPVPPVAAPAATPAPPSADASKPADAKQAAHFAALRAEKVNLRSGPSEDFPIQWVYVRRGLPVEVIATFDIWRKIRDSEGTEGWVNQQMLTGRRSVLVSGAVRDLRRDPKPDADVVAKLEVGVVASISKCDPTWCEVKAGGYKGWLMRDEVWGLEPGEVVE